MKKKMVDKPVEDLIQDLKSQAVFVRKTAIMQLEKKKATAAVDAILSAIVAEQPDFDHPEELKRLIEEAILHFAENVASMVA